MIKNELEKLDRYPLTNWPNARKMLKMAIGKGEFRFGMAGIGTTCASVVAASATMVAIFPTGGAVVPIVATLAGLTAGYKALSVTAMTAYGALKDRHDKKKQVIFKNSAGQTIQTNQHYQKQLQYIESFVYHGLVAKHANINSPGTQNLINKDLKRYFSAAHNAVKHATVMEPGTKQASPSEYQFCIDDVDTPKFTDIKFEEKTTPRSFRQGYQALCA